MTQSLPPKSLILHADDDPDDIEIVKEAFKPYPNVEVVSFDNGEALLVNAGYLSSLGLKPCLIILDVNMPRLGGKELLKELRNRKEFDETAIILFSTSTLPSEAAFAKTLNAGFVTKPLHAKQVDQIADIFIAQCPEEVRQRLRQSGRTNH
jgi:CheY-like chemotaxis protein